MHIHPIRWARTTRSPPPPPPPPHCGTVLTRVEHNDTGGPEKSKLTRGPAVADSPGPDRRFENHDSQTSKLKFLKFPHDARLGALWISASRASPASTLLLASPNFEPLHWHALRVLRRKFARPPARLPLSGTPSSRPASTPASPHSGRSPRSKSRPVGHLPTGFQSGSINQGPSDTSDALLPCRRTRDSPAPLLPSADPHRPALGLVTHAARDAGGANFPPWELARCRRGPPPLCARPRSTPRSDALPLPVRAPGLGARGPECEPGSHHFPTGSD